MTTLRDLLNQFALDVVAIEVEGDNPDDWNEQKDQLIEETLNTYKERIVG